MTYAMHPTAPTTRPTLAAAAFVLLALAAGARADVIELSETAEVVGNSVKLGHIAKLTGPDAQALANVEVATMGAVGQSIGMSDVKRRLDEAGVHWGKVTLRGALNVAVRKVGSDQPFDRSGRDAGHDANDRVPGTHVAANIVTDLSDAAAAEAARSGIQPARTVRRLVVEMVLAQLDAPPADVRITFADDTAVVLDKTEAAGRWEITPIARNAVGRIPIVIRRYEDARVVETERIRVDVAVRKTAVYAVRAIGRNQVVTASDVEARMGWIDQEVGGAITDTATIIGQRCTGLVREGAIVTTNDIQPPIMIRRGQLVTVRCMSGALVIKTVARSLDEGGEGQIVRLRNERTREEFTARVTGAQQAVMQLAGPTPHAAAAHDIHGGAR